MLGKWVLPEANRVVIDHIRTPGVSRLWGSGLRASADMMSLNATRYLWNARHKQRRVSVSHPVIGTPARTHMQQVH